jgi:AraC family transcriptional regulator, melibiose operon regulatory protein
MGKKKLNIDENLMEQTLHGDYSFPFYLSHEAISDYEQNRFECHWHSELEFAVFTDGKMEYQVNDKIYNVKAGCGMFVNQNCLHTGWLYKDMDCKETVITVDPVFIFGYENSTIETNYVSPLIESSQFPSLYLDPQNQNQQRMIHLLLEVHALYEQKPTCFELKIKSRLCELWSLLFLEFQAVTSGKETAYSKDIPRLKQVLNYIHQNYSNKLTLDEIACSCNISKSECCRFFKKAMRQTPFEYLLKYRIQKSIPLLMSQELNITEIAESIGFISASYYSEIFRRLMHCSPTEYRKQHSCGSVKGEV